MLHKSLSAPRWEWRVPGHGKLLCIKLLGDYIYIEREKVYCAIGLNVRAFAMSIPHVIKPQNHKSACWNLSEFMNRMLEMSEFVKTHVGSVRVCETACWKLPDL
ncbi:hypothetical protein HanRHA438_Chr11g0490471 [Helianthus annuus]|nr:hypothetical protein HanRHA438_Chr11g0490471 [Helianthus annuus]